MSGNAEEDQVTVQLKPKLVEAEKRLMISDADYEYLSTFKPQLFTRAAAGFLVPGAAALGACHYYKRRGFTTYVLSTCIAMLGSIFSAASLGPHVARDALLNLPPDSTLKMITYELYVIFHPCLRQFVIQERRSCLREV